MYSYGTNETCVYKAEIVNVIIWEDGFCGNCFWDMFKVTLSWKNKWNDWHSGFDRCTVLMKWRPGDWMKWAFTEFQGMYHKSKNQNLEWINCGFFKISLIHEFTCTTPRTWFGHIYMFFWTKYKIKVNPQFSCYYHFS